MSARDAVDVGTLPMVGDGTAPMGSNLFASTGGVVLGQLIAFAGAGCTPLVASPLLPGCGARPARTAIDLHGAHVGRTVLLVFEAGDPQSPIVVGLLRDAEGWPLRERIGQVEVTSDGERMVVNASEQLVLRCGKSSITLKKDGRIEIRGETIVSEAVAANHVRGGSVQLN